MGRQLTAEKQQAVLDGAMREFLAHGFATTTMDRVAAAAGVSKATVYSHFKDKRSLFEALVIWLAGEELPMVGVLQTDEVFEKDPRETLRKLANKILERTASDERFLSLVRIIIGESVRFPELAQIFVQNLEKPVLDALSQYFQKHPKINLPDAEVAARIFAGSLIHFIIFQKMLHGGKIMPMRKERLIPALIELILTSETKM